MKNIIREILCTVLLIAPVVCNAQRQDSINMRRNTLKINLINSVLFNHSAVLSYERLVNKHQSWVVMAGVVQFPTLADLGSSISVKDETRKSGYVIGGEYRFYLRKENKFTAPRGVYIGPFINYFSFQNDRNIAYTSPEDQTVTNAILKTDLRVLNIGAQIGYQFVIKNRWTVDVVFMGPSISNYSLKADLNGDFNLTEEDILSSALLTALTKRFPIVKDILTEQNVALHGKTSSWAGGFRYQLNLGYHFGRKSQKSKR